MYVFSEDNLPSILERSDAVDGHPALNIHGHISTAVLLPYVLMLISECLEKGGY